VERLFKVEGMTCASCVRRVEKALSAVGGVAQVQVNLATEEVRMVFPGAPAGDPEIAKALEARGYRMAAEEAVEADPSREALARVAVAWAGTLPLMAGMFHLFHLPWPVQALLAGVSAFGAGSGFFRRAFRQALRLETSMDTLIALGASVTWVFAVWESLQGAPHPPFESAAALSAFLLTGKFLEVKARHRATGSLEALVKLAPAVAFRLREDGSEEEVPSRLVQPGHRLRVRPGSACPVDGTVLEGVAEVEEALLTGEPLPVTKGPGDAVIAGAMVHGGALEIEASSTGRDTWLARLARQVAQAQGSRAPAQELADRVSAVFVPAVLILAALTLAGWWWHTGALALAWRPAVTLLVIACPCALGLATPVASAAALGTAARNGLLVRDASAMEALARATDLAFDKTGTLTQGRPVLQRVEGDPDTLRLAASLERNSEHPVARGILEAAAGLDLAEVRGFRSHPGQGVEGAVEGRALRLGNPAFVGHPFDADPTGVTVGLAEGDRFLGVLVLADALRDDAQATVAELSRQGLTLHLLSGDRPEPAQALGNALGIPDARGGCRPGDKAQAIQDLQAKGAVVAFVGDGVNDGPALAQADAGISLPGLEAAQAAAPLNLLREGLVPLLQARRLSLRTRTVIRQNLAWAFGYNLVLVPLAAFNLLDRFGGPMLAGAAMGLSSLTVVLNALRLRRP